MIKLHAEIEHHNLRVFVRLHFLDPHLDKIALTAGALTLYPAVWLALKVGLVQAFEYTEEVVSPDE